MKTLAGAAPCSELLWWDLLIDNTQCWGNRLRKSFWASLVRTAFSVRNDESPSGHFKQLGSANLLADDASMPVRMFRISGATRSAFGERLKKLFSEVHGGLTNLLRPTLLQDRLINSGAKSRFLDSSALSVLYFRSSFRDDGKDWRSGKVMPGVDAALCSQSDAAAKLVSAFVEICVEYKGLEEATFVIDNTYKQLLSITNGAGSTQKGQSDFGCFGANPSFIQFSWAELGGSKTKENEYLRIMWPSNRTGVVKFGMLLHNYVISNDLEANACFWSALAHLYGEGGMHVDAHCVLTSLDGSLALSCRTQIEGCVLPGQCSDCVQHEVAQSNDSMHLSLLPRIHNGCSAEGHCGSQWSKPFLMGINSSLSSAGSRGRNMLGRSIQTPSFINRAYSTSTEKQCDDDIGEQQGPSQHQSSSQQQSSLELPESKPQSSYTWANPDNAASYVLMSNIYADGDRWDEVKRINEMRLKARAWKKPGKAYVEIKAKVHEFIVGDRTHQDSVNIYEKLRKIKRHMGHIGYVPNVDLITENRSSYDPYAKR